MKKTILFIAALLVVFIPTYILVFQLAKTSPDISLGEEEIKPAYVRWCVVNRDGEEIITSRSQEKAAKQFDKADPIKIDSPSDLAELVFSREPNKALVFFYDLEGDVTYEPMTWSDFAASGVTLAGKAQAVLTVEWHISDSIRVQAAYSFEVLAP